VHVEHDVQAALAGPVNGLADAGDERVVEGARPRLERRPVHEQPHRVEPQRGDPVEVALAERDHRLEARVRLVVVAELVDVHAAQEHLAAGAVEDRGICAAGGA
jgi:hypothetical protein